MSEKSEFLISSLDMHLAFGKSPAEAWTAALEDYQYVWHSEENDDAENPILSRAATVALKHMMVYDEMQKLKT